MPPKRRAIGRSTPQTRKRRALRASESDEQRALRLENLRVHATETRSSDKRETDYLFPGNLRYASANLDLVLPVHKHNSLLAELRSAALATIHERYPDQDWLHVFTVTKKVNSLIPFWILVAEWSRLTIIPD
ncbi:hydroxysteroid dehydrogenase-like protein 1 [Trichonephila clavipes]|nr:hydroxysteroid dehydrogenase-like protein 1 [Trichonephila clavipes]